MNHSRVSPGIVVFVLLMGVLGGPSAAQACGMVKCEDPESDTDPCWDCTYSLFFFQLCHSWCVRSPGGAWHSSCWEDSCVSSLGEPSPSNHGAAYERLCQADAASTLSGLSTLGVVGAPAEDGSVRGAARLPDEEAVATRS